MVGGAARRVPPHAAPEWPPSHGPVIGAAWISGYARLPAWTSGAGWARDLQKPCSFTPC